MTNPSSFTSPTPIVLVSADVIEKSPYHWHAVPEPYLNAVSSASKAFPLILPSFGDKMNFESILDRVDGVLLTGARSNVEPSIYGETGGEEHGPFDPNRDKTTLQLARKALEKEVPVLAICRGMQELNVALGGTLDREIQQRDDRFDHRSPQTEDNDIRFQLAHDIFPKSGGILSQILGDLPVKVNSLHRQALGILSDQLKIEAEAEDGTIEAVSAKNSSRFTLAVQWHPEYWVSSDKPSRLIFSSFGDAMREYQQSKK